MNLPATRLIESTLWKEDLLTNGHCTVWGSFYEPKENRWGYACCPSLKRHEPCVAPKEASAKDQGMAGEKAEFSDHPSDESSDSRTPPPETQYNQADWIKPPPELLPREGKKPGEYIEHFARFAVGQWRKELESGAWNLRASPTQSGFTELEVGLFRDPKLLREAEEALTPLLRRLKKGDNLQRGEDKAKSRSRETRTSMEGKHIKEASVLEQLDRMASMSAERNYKEAHGAYMKLTLGNKIWNSTHVAHVAACTMKGAREYRRNRDSLNTYDMDPVSQKYMHAYKKLVQFMQCLRPSDDQSKNVVL